MKILNVILIAGLGVLNLSMVDGSTQFLSHHDFYLEHESNNPAPPLLRLDQLGGQIPSFNQWMCFPSHSASFTCAEHIQGRIVRAPMVAVYSEAEALEIETSTMEALECDEVLEAWEKMVSQQDSFCVLAAYLQDLPHENYEGIRYRSLWILEAFKAQNDYWLSPSLLDRLSSAN